MKICRTCNTEKDTLEFNMIHSTYEGVNGPIKYEHLRLDCRTCHAKKKYESLLQSKYNISLEQFQKMTDQQGGRCASCKELFTGREPFIDHCHTTNTVRALLCMKCNFGIGHFNDDIWRMEQAIEYLKAWLLIGPR